MAAWQVDFYVIPRRALAGRDARTSTALNDASWWATGTLPSDYVKRLAAVAPQGQSESATVQTWGSPDSNRIDVWSDGGRVSAVTARVDVRRLDSKFGAALLQFVRTADAVLVRDDGLLVEPTIAAYAAALRTSPAWRFASDAASYLAAYSDEDADDS